MDQFLNENNTSWPGDIDPKLSGGETLCELAGRICYMSFGENGKPDNKRYMEHIMDVKHGSVLEHANYTFIIEGVTRALTHELIRHRAGCAVSQLSTRYVDANKTKFLRPGYLQELCFYEGAETPLGSCIRYMEQDTIKYYNYIIKEVEKDMKDLPEVQKTAAKKFARQAARYVLPHTVETKLVWTANARALRHILELRGHESADVEIRQFAAMLCEIVKKESPNIFGDFEISTAVDGYPTVKSKFGRV